MSEAISVDVQTFDKVVLQSDIPVLVDFWAPWCGPCRAIAPILDQIAAEQDGKLRVVKLNVDENPSLASRYDVSSIPAMKVFQGGEVKLHIEPLARPHVWQPLRLETHDDDDNSD